MIKKLSRMIVLVGSIGWSVIVYSGPSSSGGGPGIVCLASNGKVLNAQSYDLYEAKVLFGLTIINSSAPLDSQLQLAVSRLKNFNIFIGADFEEALAEIRASMTFLPPGVVMTGNVGDLGPSYPPVAPAGCNVTYVGFYQADGVLKISKEVFDQMDSTNQAALLSHEALYRMTRNFSKATNSEDARKFTSYLFSSADMEALTPIVSRFTWNETQFLWTRGLQAPVSLPPGSSLLTMTMSNPLGREAHFNLTCEDQALAIVSRPSQVVVLGFDTVVTLPLPKECKLLHVVRSLTGDMYHPRGSLHDLGLTFDAGGTRVYEIGKTRLSESEGSVWEEFSIPIYR